MNYYSLIEDESNHLEHKTFDQLQNEFKFLQRIIDLRKNSLEDYLSINISQFVQNTNSDHQFQQYRFSCSSMGSISYRNMSYIMH